MPRQNPTDVDQTKADLCRRLRCAQGQLRGIAAMLERGADCESLVRQTLAVQGALCEINRLILKRHLEHCLRDGLQDKDVAVREKCLTEIIALYQLIGPSVPSKRKVHV